MKIMEMIHPIYQHEQIIGSLKRNMKNKLHFQYIKSNIPIDFLMNQNDILFLCKQVCKNGYSSELLLFFLFFYNEEKSEDIYLQLLKIIFTYTTNENIIDIFHILIPIIYENLIKIEDNIQSYLHLIYINHKITEDIKIETYRSLLYHATLYEFEIVKNEIQIYIRQLRNDIYKKNHPIKKNKNCFIM